MDEIGTDERDRVIEVPHRRRQARNDLNRYIEAQQPPGKSQKRDALKPILALNEAFDE
jgi:hypothetical protein